MISPQTIRSTVLQVLSGIAPEQDLARFDPRANLREALDLDSMDWLALVQGVHKELGIEIPEREYGHLQTLDDCVAWLAHHASAA